MKTFKLYQSILVGSLALGTFGLVAPTLTMADGKGASKLMFATETVQSPAAKSAHMACCADRYAQVVDVSAKGMNAGTTKAVASHLCPSCSTKIVSSGAGKAKTDAVIHSCGSNTSPNGSCCVASK